MNTRDLFLKCCQAHQWAPLHINNDGSQELDSNSIDEEAKEALNQGQALLCLDLIELAKTMGLQSTIQLQLKSTALTQLNPKTSERNHKNTLKHLPLGELVKKLLENLQEQHWPAQVLQTGLSTTDRWEVEKAILKEAEAARNADRADVSLDLINTTLEIGFNSLWLHHVKARALHKKGKLEEAIEIWEKLSTQEIEGFSEKVRSELKTAKTELILSRVQQQEASGSLDTAIEVLASALLYNPDQNKLETTLKLMLRKRRHKQNPKKESDHLEDYLDEIDLNQAFLMQVEKQHPKSASKKTETYIEHNQPLNHQASS